MSRSMPGPTRLLLAALALAGTLGAAAAATAPEQPKSGPGGADYQGKDVVKRAVGRATAATYVFHLAGEPAAARPVVILLPAWGATNPQAYGGWIEHLARKGNLVLWPRYQEVGRTRPADATGLAADLVKDALAELAGDPQARPDASRVSLVGHSAGAAVAFNLAALAGERGLPVPKLVFALMPGGVAKDAKSRGIALEDLSRIAPSTLLVTMIGDREHLPADRTAKRLLKEAGKVPMANKVFMRSLSDSHGFPVLSATLAGPASPKDAYDAAAIKLPPDPPADPKAPRSRGQKWSADMVLSGEQTVLVAQIQAGGVDALDYLGYWRTLDMASAAAFAGRTGEQLRAEPGFTDMGRWSDGWPVKRLVAEAPRIEEKAPDAAPAAQTAPERPGTASARRR